MQIKKNNDKIILGDKDMAKKKSKVTIQAKRRLFFVRPICLACIILVLVTLIKYSVDLYQLNNEKKQKEKDYFELQEESEYLRNEIVKLRDPEYLAKFARENYLYSKEGELLVKIEPDVAEVEQEEENDNKENMQIIFICSVGVGLIFIYILIKGLINRKKR